MFKIDLKKISKKIKELKAKRVLIQFPEGLKPQTINLIKKIEKLNVEVIAIMDPNYGACDANPNLLKELNAELLIHLGHLPIFEHERTLFIPLEYSVKKQKIKKISKIIEKKMSEKKINTITLITTAQYLKWIPEIKKELKIKTIIGKGTGRIKEKSQVLGCNYSSINKVINDVQGIVFIGDGFFHPIGALQTQKKPVFVLNTIEEKIIELKQNDSFLRKRFAAIQKASEAKKFGIIISRKPGQKFLKKAIELKKKIEQKKKQAILLSVDYVNETYFIGTGIDCLVNTACPRIVIDDAKNWKTNIINPNELLIALGEKKWKNYTMQELP